MSQIDIAVLGHGVVGSGVAEILLSHEENIEKKAKTKINIKYILDLKDFPGLSYSDKFIKDFDIILGDDSVKVVAEVMGGLHPAYEFVKACLENKKSVVTSNKELVAAFGAELLKIAADNNVNFLFEASVGGGIPVLRPIAQCLAANDLYEVVGILNGTTNFILTKMFKEGMQFDDALKLAQQLGYAEREPSADIDGHDACRKICILSSISFGKHVYPNQVSTEGIRKITASDVEFADSFGCVIKLVGHSKLMEDGRISAAVYPALISKESQLAGVDDVFNAIMVRGDSVGDVMFYGRGAGKLPTASAVVADVIDCVKHLNTRKYLFWEDGSKEYVVDANSVKERFYIRGNAVEGAKDEIAKVFGDVIYLSKSNKDNEIAFITSVDLQGNLLNKLKKLTLLKNAVVLHVMK